MRPVRFSLGEEVFVNGQRGFFVRILDFDRFMVRLDSGEIRVVTTQEVDKAPPVRMPLRKHDDCSPKEIEEAYRWLGALRPILSNEVGQGQRDAYVNEAAQRLGTSRATVYRRLEQWNSDPISLLPGKRPGGQGKSRLGQEREALLAHILDKEYLNRRQRSVVEVYRDFVEPAFATCGLMAPSLPTVYRYVADLHPVLTIERRIGKRAARDARAKLQGKFPFGTAPLSCVVSIR